MVVGGWAALWDHRCEPNPPPVTAMSPRVKRFKKLAPLGSADTLFGGKTQGSRGYQLPWGTEAGVHRAVLGLQALRDRSLRQLTLRCSHPHTELISNKCSKIPHLKTIPVMTWTYKIKRQIHVLRSSLFMLTNKVFLSLSAPCLCRFALPAVCRIVGSSLCGLCLNSRQIISACRLARLAAIIKN